MFFLHIFNPQGPCQTFCSILRISSVVFFNGLNHHYHSGVSRASALPSLAPSIRNVVFPVTVKPGRARKKLRKGFTAIHNHIVTFGMIPLTCTVHNVDLLLTFISSNIICKIFHDIKFLSLRLILLYRYYFPWEDDYISIDDYLRAGRNSVPCLLAFK